MLIIFVAQQFSNQAFPGNVKYFVNIFSCELKFMSFEGRLRMCEELTCKKAF